MLNRLFPKHIDNDYRGHGIAIALLVLIVLLRLAGSVSAMGGNPWVDNRFMLRTGNGIPLDTFSAEAADTVVFLFAISGLRYLALYLMGVVVLIRYRSMIPMMFLLLLLAEIGGKALAFFNPIVRIGTPPVANINLAFVVALLIGLALSLGKINSTARSYCAARQEAGVGPFGSRW